MCGLSCGWVHWRVWQCSAVSVCQVFQHRPESVLWRPVRCHSPSDQYKRRSHLPGYEGDVNKERNRAKTSGTKHRWSPCYDRERERSCSKTERGQSRAHSLPLHHSSICPLRLPVRWACWADEYNYENDQFSQDIVFVPASLLREFLREVDANADDLLLHNSVRWVSKGRVLERFRSIRREVAANTVFSLFRKWETDG